MILVTGAAGFIGSHTSVELLCAKYSILGIDNFINSNVGVLSKIQQITNKSIPFVEGDICDLTKLRGLFANHSIHAVIHFAALKAVSDSVANPSFYYQNNLMGLINLLTVMKEFDCRFLIFSSSATVYDPENEPPFLEGMSENPINPYGRTKLFSEKIIKDLADSWPNFRYMLLRYFNPVGAHGSGQLGEAPQETPNNLMPYIADVASGKREKLYVFGGDWPTEDGTGVRDYVHIQDLADAHVAALKNLTGGGQSQTLNIGTGIGCSVLGLLHAYEKVSGRAIPYEIVARRPGDVAVSYADVSLAKKVLGWEAHRDIYKMCEDSWRWTNLNL